MRFSLPKGIIQKYAVFFAITIFFVSLFFIPVQFGLLDQNITADTATVYAATDGTGSPDAAKTLASFNKTEKTIYQIFVAIGSWVLGIGGRLLEVSIATFVIDMGGFMNREGLTPAIGELWEVVRDIFNLIFIFGIIYIGFRTILRIDESGTRRSLGLLLVAALLINFSLFTTKLVVDFSNLLAYEINRVLVATPFDLDDTSEGKSIAGKIVTAVSLDNFEEDRTAELGSHDKGGAGIHIALMMGLVTMLFMIITGFVFAAGAILMISRFVMLIVFMVFSPAIFLGWILPQFASKSREWWQQFLKYALMAPAYLFMIHLSFTVLDKIDITSHGDLASAVGAVSDSDVTNPNFLFLALYLMVTGLMWASLVVAQKLGVFGADRIVKFGQNSARNIGKNVGSFGATTAGRIGFGMPAWAAQRYFGRMAAKGSESEKLRDRAATKGFKGAVARAHLATLNKVADSSFDARRIGNLGKNIGIGEGKKGGYSSRVNESSKAAVKYAESLGYNKTEAKKIEKNYLQPIALAEKAVSDKRIEVDNDPTIVAAREQVNNLGAQLNAANTGADRQRISEQIKAQREVISNRQEQIGLDSAVRDLNNLKSEKEKEIGEVKKNRATEYSKTIGGSGVRLGATGIQFRHQNEADAAAIIKKIDKGKEDEILERLDALNSRMDNNNNS